MSHELLQALLTLTVVSSAAALLTLGLRRPVLRLLGAAASCSMWLLVPVSMAAVLLPQAHGTVTAPSTPLLATPPLLAVKSLLHWSFAIAVARPGALAAWVMWAWIAGAAVTFCYFFAQQRAFVRRFGIQSGGRRVLRAQATAGCPAVMGLLRPNLILPADFRLRYTPLERRLILAHERALLRRCDLTWNALATLLRCLFWFNPLAHLAAACFRADQELACDAAVMLRHPGVRRTYAAAMLKTHLAAASAFTCSWNSASQLKERLQMLGRAPPGRARRTCGQACAALACLATAYTAWAAQPTEPPNGVPPPALTTTPGQTQAAPATVVELQIDGQTLQFFIAGQAEVEAAQAIMYGPGKGGSLRVVQFALHDTRGMPDASQGGPGPSAIADGQILSVQADTADLTDTPGGFHRVRFEDGCTVTLKDPSGQALWSLAGAKCSLRLWTGPARQETHQP